MAEGDTVAVGNIIEWSITVVKPIDIRPWFRKTFISESRKLRWYFQSITPPWFRAVLKGEEEEEADVRPIEVTLEVDDDVHQWVYCRDGTGMRRVQISERIGQSNSVVGCCTSEYIEGMKHESRQDCIGRASLEVMLRLKRNVTE